jgi:phosphoglycerate kinase
MLGISDSLVIGGAMANTFLAASGIQVGNSLYDKDELSLARDLIDKAKSEAKKRKFTFYLPQDGVVSKTIDGRSSTRIVDWDAHVIAEIESYPAQPTRQSSAVADDEMILDIGPFSGAFMAGLCQMSESVFWNGTLGMAEVNALHGPIGPFAQGTQLLIDSMIGHFGHRPFSLIGGGDTVAYLESKNLTGKFDHVSTGGGASLELIIGKKLPGVESLEDKS